MSKVLVDIPAYTCHGALMLYGSLDGRDTGVVLAHDVQLAATGQPIIGAGHVVGKKVVGEMLKSLQGKAHSLAYLPENILAQGEGTTVWFAPPAKRAMYFRPDGGKEVSGVAWQPGLVFMVRGHQWWVWAVRSDVSRPKPDTPLFHAPHMNVWASGEICTGNTRLPRKAKAFNPQAWEEAFWHSWFTHANDPDQRRIAKGSLLTFWEKQMKSGKRFPDSQLVPTRKKLADILRG